MASGPFRPKSEVHIRAPAAQVFELLRRWPDWNRWNSFVPRAKIVRAGWGALATDEDQQQLQLGQKLRFSVQFESRSGQRHMVPMGSVEEIVRLDCPELSGGGDAMSPRRVDWAQRSLPNFLLRTVRVNEVVPAGPEGTECIYRTSMVFEGLLSGLVVWFTGEKVQNGLDRWAAGLKEAAENG